MKILLDHTPKCGGSFLRTSLESYFHEEKIALYYKQKDDGRDVFEGNVESFDFICGHYTYNHPNGTLINFDKVKDWIKIKNFRHPIDWVRSKYFFGLEILLYDINFFQKYQTQESFKEVFESHIYGPKLFVQNIYSTSGSIYNHFPDMRMLNDTEFLKNNFNYLIDSSNITSFSEYLIKNYNLTKVRDIRVHYNDTRRSKKLYEYFHEQIFDITNLFEADIEIYNKLKEIAWKDGGS